MIRNSDLGFRSHNDNGRWLNHCRVAAHGRDAHATFFWSHDKIIQVDSSKTGKDEAERIERLLKVEDTDEPTQIVIHSCMTW